MEVYGGKRGGMEAMEYLEDNADVLYQFSASNNASKPCNKEAIWSLYREYYFMSH
jgi:hypothetical protein